MTTYPGGFRLAVAFGVIVLASCLAEASDPVLFTKGVMADVKIYDAPSTGREVKRIDLVACPGEFEPFSLAIWGSVEGLWRFEVSDLRSEGIYPFSMGLFILRQAAPELPALGVFLRISEIQLAQGLLVFHERVRDRG